MPFARRALAYVKVLAGVRFATAIKRQKRGMVVVQRGSVVHVVAAAVPQQWCCGSSVRDFGSSMQARASANLSVPGVTKHRAEV
jgi:hypothetical protein